MSSPQKISVGLVGTDSEVNLDRAVEKVQEAIRGGANIICLPELFRSQYFCQQEDASLFDLAESIPGPSTEVFSDIARISQVVIIVPLFERRAAGLYHNSVVVLNEQGEMGSLYRKMHIPDDPAYYEKFYFTPGDQGFQAVLTPFGKVGTLICWDQWYPEAARLTALQGADILFYPTAIGWHPSEKTQEGESQRDAWLTVQRAHAITNGVFVAAVNRVGIECPNPGQDGLEFWGGSFLCDPFGVMIAEASSDKEEVVLAEIDLGRIEEVRRNWPFLRDRRIDAYEGMTLRYLDQTS
jgi:N-carbamoylputrescine amidase